MDTVLKEKKRTDTVILVGSRFGDRDRQLIINGARPIRLDRREFMILRILGDFRKKSDEFLPVSEILERIQLLNAENSLAQGLDESTGFWVYPVAGDVYVSVAGLRKKLEAVLPASSLIEKGPRGEGYRISVIPAKIFISLS